MDVTIVVTGHNEGNLAHFTFGALRRALHHAKIRGLSTEVVGVLDNADLATEDVFTEWLSSGSSISELSTTTVITTTHGDCGLARNAGIALAAGKYVCVLDADNLVPEGWISEAFVKAEDYGRDCVVHPSVLIRFGQSTIRSAQKLQVWRMWSTLEDCIRVENFTDFNHWDAFCLAPRSVFEALPYHESRPGSGFGYEDWHWFVGTIQAGLEHLVVADMPFFYRLERAGSLLQAHIAHESIVGHHPFFTDAERARSIKHEAQRGGGFSPPTGPAQLSAKEIAEWNAMHAIDPYVPIPHAQTLESAERFHPPVDCELSQPSAVWWQVVEALGELRPEVMLFVAAMDDEDNGRSVRAHIEQLKRLLPECRVVVVGTDAPSANRQPLPHDVAFIDLTTLSGYQYLRTYKRARLVSMLVNQYRPHTMHAISSAPAFDAVELWSRSMASATSLFLTDFENRPEQSRSAASLFFRRPVDFLDRVSGVILDSQHLVDRLVAVCRLDRSKFFVNESLPADLATLPGYVPRTLPRLSDIEHS